ncbi:hypothetical protein VP01_2799g2 [Puccinia sorghi]|uniref:Uncharacterized protein n=1 Tax=Puccinia sorghi TaxID=27349 RepID=A0A0L6V2L8_9BASI|nr:hypothetical protein VP01_2799g2 [Puccinia sorghi]
MLIKESCGDDNYNYYHIDGFQNSDIKIHITSKFDCQSSFIRGKTGGQLSLYSSGLKEKKKFTVMATSINEAMLVDLQKAGRLLYCITPLLFSPILHRRSYFPLTCSQPCLTGPERNCRNLQRGMVNVPAAPIIHHMVPETLCSWSPKSPLAAWRPAYLQESNWPSGLHQLRAKFERGAMDAAASFRLPLSLSDLPHRCCSGLRYSNTAARHVQAHELFSSPRHDNNNINRNKTPLSIQSKAQRHSRNNCDFHAIISLLPCELHSEPTSSAGGEPVSVDLFGYIRVYGTKLRAHNYMQNASKECCAPVNMQFLFLIFFTCASWEMLEIMNKQPSIHNIHKIIHLDLVTLNSKICLVMKIEDSQVLITKHGLELRFTLAQHHMTHIILFIYFSSCDLRTSKKEVTQIPTSTNPNSTTRFTKICRKIGFGVFIITGKRQKRTKIGKTEHQDQSIRHEDTELIQFSSLMSLVIW